MFKKLFIFFFVIGSIPSFGDQGLTIVSIGQAEIETESIYFSFSEASTFEKNEKKVIKEFVDLLKDDFVFYKKKFSIAEKKISSRYQLHLELTKERSQLVAKVTLSKKENALAQFDTSFSMGPNTIREAGHNLAGKIYKKITGKSAIFNSKIIFVSDRDGTKKKPVKELYIMDFDGRRKRRLTYHKGTVISPALSNDGLKVLYSLISSKISKARKINLRIMDIKTGKSRLVSSKKGINSGAIFMPDGKSISLTLSHVGNAEIFVMNLETKKLRRLTKSFNPDVDPSISYDGKLMTFLSGRSGKAMIYTMDPSALEKKVKRISYVGKYNATPRFSPDGKEIVFSSWLDERFDLFRIDSSGRNLSRLTKDFGSNEDPTYSKDGEFISFSSLRVLSKTKADQNIYIMDRDGEILGKLTNKFGNCITPRWSK